MPQAQASTPVIKRGPGRPPKNAASPSALSTKPPQRLASPAIDTPGTASPALSAPILPIRISDTRPLPTLSQRQPLDLPNDEYQTIAASNVLATALERSRQQWTKEGIFQRYWVKPETGKNAKPPPPNNPELKWMKLEGPCRLRIEPHIFEADVYIERKPRPPAAKQYIPSQPFTASYGQRPYQQAQPFRPQFQPPLTQQPQPLTTPAAAARSPATAPGNAPTMQQSHPQPSRAQPPPAAAPEKKASPDPVISMLANRASSDPELKALMKEVATGNASQDQLRVFQKHIDELTALIQKQRKEEEQKAARSAPASISQFDGAAAPPPPPPSQPQPQSSIPPFKAPIAQPPPPAYNRPTWTTPPPPPTTNLPVIFAFTSQGATEDRFLFPEHSILESLSPQHLLVSFIVTRTADKAIEPPPYEPPKPTLPTPSTSEPIPKVTSPAPDQPAAAADTTAPIPTPTTPTTNPNKAIAKEQEYWQPITMMVEVAYGREEILAHIRRWVQPPDAVRAHMEAVMARCRRAPSSHLALRLPHKGSAAAAAAAAALEGAGGAGSEDGSGVVSKEGTPVGDAGGRGGKAGRKVGSMSGLRAEVGVGVEGEGRKRGPKKVKIEEGGSGAGKEDGKGGDGVDSKVVSGDVAGTEAKTVDGEGDVAMQDATKDAALPAGATSGEGVADTAVSGEAAATTEGGRPRRTVRKSVRISEG